MKSSLPRTSFLLFFSGNPGQFGYEIEVKRGATGKSLASPRTLRFYFDFRKTLPQNITFDRGPDADLDPLTYTVRGPSPRMAS